MFTDMVGFTALTQSDEAQSLAVLERHNRLLRPIFPKYHGREVKSMGDSFLVEFDSALDATNCAVEVQRFLHDYNISSRDEWKVTLRIGIHLGDVVRSGEDILGDAVNIASRLQPLAEPEGVCISEQVYDQVRNKIPQALVKLDAHDLKGVRFAVDIYRLIMPWERVAPAAAAQSDRNRIAVLPFNNFSPEPSDEYFADGLTEEMIGTLSKIRELSVISRTSVMQYKGKPKPIPEISRELNAGTILEGSVRKAGNRARVSVQVIEAADDKHVWAENYDRDLQDIFAVQSDIAEKVAEALKVKLLSTERKEISQAPTKSVEANLHYLRGIYEIDKGSPSNMLKAIGHFERAIEEDPGFATAYSRIADNYISMAGESMSGDRAFPKAKEYIDRALQLDPKLSFAYGTNGWLAFQYQWNWTEAENNLRQAIDLSPSNSNAHSFYGRVLACLGRFDEAISEMKRAYELDPASPWTAEHFGVVYYTAGRNEEAREMFLEALENNPRFAKARMGLAFVYAAEKKSDDSKIEADAAAATDSEILFQAFRAMVHANVGSSVRAREILERIQTGLDGYVAPANIAAIYYNLGDRERGYEWMKRAREERDPTIPWSSMWPIFDAARKDLRFVEMLKELKLP